MRERQGLESQEPVAEGVHAKDNRDRDVVQFLDQEARDQGQAAGDHGHGEGDEGYQTPGDRGEKAGEAGEGEAETAKRDEEHHVPNDIEDAQDEDHEQEAAQADQEEAGQRSHGRGRVRQPLGGWRQEKIDRCPRRE